MEYNLKNVQTDMRGGSMKTALKAVGVLLVGLFWMACVALSVAVQVAILRAAYHFITHYRG
jgi:hypothetical protein